MPESSRSARSTAAKATPSEPSSEPWRTDIATVTHDTIHEGGGQDLTDLLAKDVREGGPASRPEQDAFARWLLDELESERRWSHAFDASQSQLAELAREAVTDDRAERNGTDVTRRLGELFADPQLRREQLQTAAELDAAGSDWGDELW